MSLSYRVYLGTPAPALGAAQTAPVRDHPHDGGTAVARSFGHRVSHTPHPLTQTMIEESYGFRPAAVVVYRLDKHLDGESMERGTIEDISDVLRTDRGDAYVDYSGLRTAILRRAGRTTVDAEWLRNRPWLRPDLRALLGTDYTVDDIPLPE